GQNLRRLAAVPVGHPAPAHTGKENDQIGSDANLADRARRQFQVDLQVRWEQYVDRIIENEAAGHEPAGVQRVEDHAAFEDADERRPDLARLGALETAVLDPDLRLLDKDADIKHRQGRQHADP